jgi:DegV family protein with EDD domain
MKIVTDSAAEMTTEELATLGITQAPLLVMFPEGAVSSIDMTPDAFYDRLARMYPAIPTTAQPSSGVFAEIYGRLSGTDPQIVSVHISSGLSGTLNAARAAAEQIGPHADVTLWDTMTLSGGERFQVLAAALAANAGWKLDAIQHRLLEIRARTETCFTLETLEYLARGGRIGRVQALAGSLLHVKPIIRVEHNDGKYSTLAKSRTIARALETIADHLSARYGNTPLWATVMHGRVADQAAVLAQQLRERLNVVRMETLRVSPALGVHTGPGVVGACVVPMELVEDLLERSDAAI